MSKKTHDCSCGGLACGEIVNERNRWFTGKFVTARAYRTEQEHFLSHRWLHNRMLHGWGIVHGLKVSKHPDEECAERWAVVDCGMAIDCCGRELILPTKTAIELPLPDEVIAEIPDVLDDEDQEIGSYRSDPKGYGEKINGDEEYDEDYDQDYPGDESEQDHPTPADSPEPWLICLRYAEVEIEQVPSLQSEGDCDPSRTEANFVRQTATIDVGPLSGFESDCWRLPGGDDQGKCRDDCDDEIHEDCGCASCLDPICPCGSCVPLALIYPADPESGWAGGYEIDLDGRRNLPTPYDRLTHVSGVNWPHGGEIALSELRDDLGGRLEIRFDRRIRETVDEATGINEHTFVVQYGGVQQDLEFLASNDEQGPWLDDDCTAVFEIDESYLKGKRTIAGSVVYVTLKCDFILDCHGNPVDGEHLKGRLPSGDGVAGGTFESWFRVVADGGPALHSGKGSETKEAK